jgi:hypothetical protein
MAPEANAVRGEVVPFPAERIIWIRPRQDQGRCPPLDLEGDQMAIIHAGVTRIYASPEVFEAVLEARRARPADDAPPRQDWRGWFLLLAGLVAGLALRGGL